MLFVCVCVCVCLFVCVCVCLCVCVQTDSGYRQRFSSAAVAESDDLLPALGCRENIPGATVVREELLLLDVVTPCTQVQSAALSTEQGANHPVLAVAAVFSQGASLSLL